MFEGSSKADEEEQWSRRGPPPPTEGRERSRGKERSGEWRMNGKLCVRQQ